MKPDPRLEHDLALSDLVHAESLNNLCLSFAALLGAGITVTNLDGSVLSGEPAIQELCRPRHGNGDSRCPVCQADRAWWENLREKVAPLACFSGRKYIRTRVDNQFEPVGQMLFGPFVEEPGDADDERLPCVPASRAVTAVQLLCTVIEEIVFANHQNYLVSKMTLQEYGDKMTELLDKDEELAKFEDTLKESKELRSLF